MSLPDSILGYICGFCDEREHGRLARTCQVWSRVARSYTSWCPGLTMYPPPRVLNLYTDTVTLAEQRRPFSDFWQVNIRATQVLDPEVFREFTRVHALSLELWQPWADPDLAPEGRFAEWRDARTKWCMDMLQSAHMSLSMLQLREMHMSSEAKCQLLNRAVECSQLRRLELFNILLPPDALASLHKLTRLQHLGTLGCAHTNLERTSIHTHLPAGLKTIVFHRFDRSFAGFSKWSNRTVLSPLLSAAARDCTQSLWFACFIFLTLVCVQ